jgi:tetratricopeptide (TPR) repeat protein
MGSEGRYLAAVFTDLEQHSAAWTALPQERMAAALAEYRYLAESLASEFGAIHRNFTGDGHLVLFESADAAVRFGLNAIRSWSSTSERLAQAGVPHMPLRVGCHFGECLAIDDGSDWVGRAIILAKRVEGAASGDSLLLTESMLELLDLPVYRFEPAGMHALKGDHLSSRALYRVSDLDSDAILGRGDQDLSGAGWFLRAVELLRSGADNTAEEEACYRHALALRPDYPEAHNNLGAVLRSRGDHDSAAERYREALRLRPDYPEAHYNYALLLETLGSTSGAASHYLRALSLRPEYVDAHYGYANLMASLGDRDDAMHHYEIVLSLRPAHSEAHSNYAMLLEDAGDMAGARDHYRAAVAVHAPPAEAHYNYALFLEAQSERKAAVEEYRAAIETRPEFAEAHNNLAALLQLTGELTSAEVHYRRALALRPNDPETHYNLGILLRALNDDAAADEQLRIARELSPDSG